MFFNAKLYKTIITLLIKKKFLCQQTKYHLHLILKINIKKDNTLLTIKYKV